MKIDRMDLLNKGWSAAEVNHAEHIIGKAENKKHRNIKIFDNTTYWILLCTLMIGNIICAIFLIPFLFAIQSFFVAVIVAIIGLIFGVLFSLLIFDIEKVGVQNQMSLMVSLFFSGILNFGLIIIFARNFASKTGIVLVHNIFIIASIYLLAFLMPHIVYLARRQPNHKF